MTLRSKPDKKQHSVQNLDALKKKAAGPKKKRVTFYLPVEVIERARDVAYWDRTTLNALAADSLTELMDKLEKKRGTPYPPREDELTPGPNV